MVKAKVIQNAISGAATTFARTTGDVDKLEVVLHETSVKDLKLQRCIAIFLGWINKVIEPSRMLAQDFFDDLYDSKILIKLIEIKTGHVVPASMTAVTYKAILANAKGLCNYLVKDLKISKDPQWTAEALASKQVQAILFLVRDIAHYFEMTDPLPPSVEIVCVYKEKKTEGHIERKVVKYPFTGAKAAREGVQEIAGGSDDEDELPGDVFDKLLLASADKVERVRELLLEFANTHLAKLTGNPGTLTSFNDQLSDGVHLIQLLGILGKFYIAQNEYYVKPTDEREKAHNMKVVISILNQIGIECRGLKKQEIMNGEEGAIMRTLYRIYSKFKHAS